MYLQCSLLLLLPNAPIVLSSTTTAVTGESLRRAIDVVRCREASGRTGLATARRERASAERRRSIVGAMVERSL